MTVVQCADHCGEEYMSASDKPDIRVETSITRRRVVAAGIGEADGFILDQVRALLGTGLQSGGKTYPVQIITKDSQSSGNRAAEVASELILGDKVDLIVASATPDTTNPVADQAEVNEVPCITTNCPWQ